MARSRKHHEPNREALIRIALELFIKHGYENTTVTQIMEAAGLSKGGMYHYFSSKEEILDSVIQYGLNQELDRIQHELDGLPTEEKLPYFATNTNIGEFAEKLLAYSSSHRDSILGYRLREYNLHCCIPVLRAIFEEGIEAGLFRTAYPKEMAEFCALMVRAIADTNLLPDADEDGKRRRVEVFMTLMNAGLNIVPAYAAKLGSLFGNEHKKTEGDSKCQK